MKLNGRKSMFRLLTVIMLLALAACTDEYNENAPKTDGDVRVKFAIQLPGANTPATRALEEIDENEVTEIDVLVFNQGGGLAYTAECKGGIETDKTDSKKKTFTVELKQGKYDLVIVANAHSIIAATTLTGTKAQVLASLTAKMPAGGKWIATKTELDYDPMPMWGDIGPKTINDQTDLTGTNAVPLTRMLARVDVKVDAAVGKSTFELTSVRVYNYNTHGTVAPVEKAWSKDEEKVTEPTIPSAATLTKGPLVYNNEDNKTEINTTGNNCIGDIYIFEAENHTDTEGDDESKKHKNAKGLLNRTCLVVGGVYDSQTYYYRIDFFSKSGDTKTYLDVLRNHQYVFNITSVSGPGYDDPEIAFKSEPINIEANVLPWNQADMGNIVFDGQNMLAVSEGEFSFGSNKIVNEQGDNVFYVQTDYTNADASKSGWRVEKIVDATDDTKAVTWVKTTTNGTTALTGGVANIKAKVVLAVDENTDGEERNAVIWIAAGRLRYAVKVKQSNVQPLSVELLADNQPAQVDMLFVSHEGSVPDARTLTVNWLPKDADLNITNTAVGVSAFPSGVGAPETGTVLGGNNGTGTKTYTILPTLSEEELKDNPFVDRMSKFDFSTTNGQSEVSASIFIRQINYALIADGLKSEYVLDGQTKTIKIRANFGWKVTKIMDDDKILQNASALEGIEGGYQTATGTGDEIQFTLAAFDLSKTEKIAKIQFTNQIDGSTYFIDIAAVAPPTSYVGKFAGELKANAQGVWQFERELYVQNTDESIASQWQSDISSTDVNDKISGRENTYSLYNKSIAATLCYEKNSNHSSISSASELTWYLPAQRQLLAIWVVHDSFASKFNDALVGYWSSTEGGPNGQAFKLHFHGGPSTLSYAAKTSSLGVRCVRETL